MLPDLHLQMGAGEGRGGQLGGGITELTVRRGPGAAVRDSTPP
jgi:hypothetical protein